MKERMTITIDKDIYDLLQELPRKVSLSEVISWSLKAMFQDIKIGRELSSEELKEWVDRTPEGKDFRRRLKEQWGPTIAKLDESIAKITGSGKKKNKKHN